MCLFRQLVYAGLVVAATSAVILTGCDRNASNATIEDQGLDGSASTAPLSSEQEAKVVAFCGDCHAMPDPSSFPRHAWHDEVKRGYDFYYASGRTDLEIPVREIANRYFTQRAAANVDIINPAGVDRGWVTKFERLEVSIPDVDTPAISFIDSVDFGEPLGRGVIFSDMRGGGIYFSGVESGTIATPIELAEVQNPATVRLCDWDRDGLMDLIVADLGSFLPADHDRGQVVWCRQVSSDNVGEDIKPVFETVPLWAGVGRVASVEVADFDSDGLQDVLVAEFGWQTTGSISLLRRAMDATSPSSVVATRLDARAGTIHLPVADLNGDGHQDFVALISQHHECIEAFINDGKGSFQRKLIFSAPEPAFGSSGIQLVDWNEDGRVDILYTNGDSFDSFYLKPAHGIRWLENLGTLEFATREIGKMPGVHRALAVKLSGTRFDSVIAGAFLPSKLMATQGIKEAEGLVLWSELPDGSFQRHVLNQTETSYAAIAIHEEASEAPLILVGHFRETDVGPAITVWKLK